MYSNRVESYCKKKNLFGFMIGFVWWFGLAGAIGGSWLGEQRAECSNIKGAFRKRPGCRILENWNLNKTEINAKYFYVLHVRKTVKHRTNRA